jgi:hypothetical protein
VFLSTFNLPILFFFQLHIQKLFQNEYPLFSNAVQNSQNQYHKTKLGAFYYLYLSNVTDFLSENNKSENLKHSLPFVTTLCMIYISNSGGRKEEMLKEVSFSDKKKITWKKREGN